MKKSVDREDTRSFDLRFGGTAEIHEDSLQVKGSDGDSRSFPADEIVSASLKDIDWFLAVMSVALSGFGVLSLDRHLLLGIGFTAAGVVSLWLTYRKRNQITIRVKNRTSPVTLHPVNASVCYSTIEEYIGEEK